MTDAPALPFLAIAWVALAVVIVGAAVRANRSRTARIVGRVAVAVLYVGAGAAVNAAFLVTGTDYASFADGSYVPFVRETWRSVVAPHQAIFISGLVAFEALIGVLVLSGGRRTQLGLAGAIAFHVALMSFGWGFYAWSVPMIAALAALLRSERSVSARTADEIRPHSPAGSVTASLRHA